MFKQGRSGSQLWWSLRYGETKEVSSTVTQIYCPERASWLQQRDKNSELRRWSWHFREAGAARYAGQILLRKLQRESRRDLQRVPLESWAEDWAVLRDRLNVDGYMKNSFWKLQLNHQKMKNYNIWNGKKYTGWEQQFTYCRGKGELTYHWTLSKMKNRIKITEKNNKRVSVSCGIMSTAQCMCN